MALIMGSGKCFKIGTTAIGYPDGDDLEFTEKVFEDIEKHPDAQENPMQDRNNLDVNRALSCRREEN